MGPKTKTDFPNWLDNICQRRRAQGPSITYLNHKSGRVRRLKGREDLAKLPPSLPKCDILYWMIRDQRVQDNWAFLYAEKLARKYSSLMHTCFCLTPRFQADTLRHFTFMIDGLAEVEKECRELNIPFHLVDARNISTTGVVAGSKRSHESSADEFFALNVASPVAELVRRLNIGCVVTDFSPLREQNSWVAKLAQLLPVDIPFFQVDAHNVVPVWIASPRLEHAARTIRPKIHQKLPLWLTEFPPLVGNPDCNKNAICEPVDWKKLKSLFNGDRSVNVVDWAKGGTTAGLRMLWDFINTRLPSYDKFRNDPTKSALSGLSPWLHFGQISAQRVILEVNAMRHLHKAAVDAFVEETLIRRELADNFCFYNSLYDKLEGASGWAQETLLKHANDVRNPGYNDAQFEAAKTHDQLWNASQRQLVRTGKLHGFLRMYWAKKILEWHEDGPKAAIRLALYLNDHYSLDGSDPNGVVGVMWSICGVHDQGWAERAIFGKIRCMTYKGCQGKFPVSVFESSYPA